MGLSHGRRSFRGLLDDNHLGTAPIEPDAGAGAVHTITLTRGPRAADCLCHGDRRNIRRRRPHSRDLCTLYRSAADSTYPRGNRYRRMAGCSATKMGLGIPAFWLFALFGLFLLGDGAWALLRYPDFARL